MHNLSTYQIQVRLQSEAIFASGEKERNLVHSKALTDPYGFVYFHAKSFKGQLKKQAFWLWKQYDKVDSQRANSFLHSLVTLFGINKLEIDAYGIGDRVGAKDNSGIALTNLELAESIRNYFINLMVEEIEEGYIHFSASDLVEAQTNIRTQIELENGTAKDKRLTTIQTVKEGLIFYSTVTFLEPPTENLLSDLKQIVNSLSRIGAGIHRGRGEVEACLLCNGKEM
ncbi:hypothetical protein SFC15_05575 [Shouchella clausii]